MTAPILDPLDLDLPSAFKPHFAYAPSKAPADLADLAGRIEAAEGYVMVSPEDNHAMSPALADLLNHFGSSLFSFKPSAIVTYSAGQWGGTRAAVNMRTFLSELGCLPVSAMIDVPHAQDVLVEDGRYADGVDADRWHGYLGRTFEQLIWWAEAAPIAAGGIRPLGPLSTAVRRSAMHREDRCAGAGPPHQALKAKRSHSRAKSSASGVGTLPVRRSTSTLEGPTLPIRCMV